jgi:hypothetical protein
LTDTGTVVFEAPDSAFLCVPQAVNAIAAATKRIAFLMLFSHNGYDQFP